MKSVEELHEALHQTGTTLEITYGLSLTGGVSTPGIRITRKIYKGGKPRPVKDTMVLFPPKDQPQSIGAVLRSLASIADTSPRPAGSADTVAGE